MIQPLQQASACSKLTVSYDLLLDATALTPFRLHGYASRAVQNPGRMAADCGTKDDRWTWRDRSRC